MSEATEGAADVGETIHSALTDAFEKHDVPLNDDPVVSDTPATREVTEAPDTARTERTDGRDATGRFAPRRVSGPPPRPEAEGAAPVVPAGDPAPGAATQPAADPGAVQEPHAKAPVSWKPEEREHWNAIPAAAREAVQRREMEVTRALQESSESRRGIDAIRQTLAPYMPNIQAANGGDAIGAIKTFFDYDNRLRHGSQIEKARAVTALIKGYGVDITALDTELAGAQHSPQSAQQDAVAQALQRELAPMRDYIAQMQQREAERAQHAEQNIAQTVEQSIGQFAAAPENKHFQAVRNDMADLLDLAKMQGRDMTLKQAYETACWQNPQVRSMLLTEQAAQTGAGRTATAQRARSAAVGVTGAPRVGGLPSAAQANGRDDRTADVRAAWDAALGRE